MPQPSAQGIASLYMGNPAALQQKVQKEQQAKPGLPPDLKNLMALNIVTNEQDAAKRQAAMNALNQMAPDGQEPPTIAQSIQQQAKQKLQAQMLQQQRQQQGLQALAKQSPSMEVPENVPQPETQPQGIDELPVDMEFAGGGIVGYSNGESVFAQMDREKADKLKELNSQLEQINPMLAAAARSGDPQAIQRYAQQAQSIRQQINAVRESAGNRAAGIEALMTPPDARTSAPAPATPAPAPTPAPTPAPAPAGISQAAMDQGRAPMPGAPMERGRMGARRSADEVLAGLKAAAEQRAPRPAPAPAAPAPQVPAAAPATGLDALYEQNLRKRMELDPAARAEQLRKRHEEMVGAPDTSQYDRYMADLEARRKQFEGPRAGFDAFAELMGQIAAAGPRRTSGEAGAAGVASLSALRKDRQAQQFELTKQLAEAAQKKLEVERGYKKDLFALTEKERDDIDKQVQDATKEYGLNKRDADKYKRDLEMEALRHKNQLALEGVRAKNQAANRPFDLQGELAKAVLAGDTPRAEKLQKALSMGSTAKRPGLDMENLKKFESLPGVKADMDMLNILRMKKNPKPEDMQRIQTLQQNLLARAQANGIDPEQIGLASGSSTPQTGTRTIDWNSIK